MRRARVVLWALGILLTIAVVVAISVPNLRKARISNYAYSPKSAVVLNSMADLSDGKADRYVNVSAQKLASEKKFIFNGISP
jgi:hypothetical protein